MEEAAEREEEEEEEKAGAEGVVSRLARFVSNWAAIMKEMRMEKMRRRSVIQECGFSPSHTQE